MSIWSVTSCTSIDRGRMHYDQPELHDLWLAQEKLPERTDNARGANNFRVLDRSDNDRSISVEDNQHHSAA